MEKEQRRQKLRKVLEKSERGTVTRLAEHLETNTGLIYQWLKEEGPWPSFRKERKVWAFLGYDLTDAKEIVLRSPTLPDPYRPFTQLEIKELLDLIAKINEELKLRLAAYEAAKHDRHDKK